MAEIFYRIALLPVGKQILSPIDNAVYHLTHKIIPYDIIYSFLA